jgi:hypothetical protein
MPPSRSSNPTWSRGRPGLIRRNNAARFDLASLDAVAQQVISSFTQRKSDAP